MNAEEERRWKQWIRSTQVASNYVYGNPHVTDEEKEALVQDIFDDLKAMFPDVTPEEE